MKKLTMILCIAGGVILLAGACIFAFVPGIFTYLHTKLKYENIDRTIPQFEKVSVPEDFVQYSIRGLTLSVPEDYTLSESGHVLIGGDGKTRVFIMQSDSLETAAILAEYSPEWSADETFTDDEYQHYFESVGAPVPSDADARSDSLWYSKGVLQPEDCLKLRGTDRKIFAEFAEAKDGAWGMEQTWSLPFTGAVAYFNESTDELTLSVATNTVCIYPDDSRTSKIFVTMREQDPQTVKQIVSSMQLAE